MIEQSMREAIKFFADNNFSTPEIIKRGWKQGLTEGQIRAGMVRVYERVKSGEKIKPIRLVWQAWEEAKKVQGDEFMALEMDRETLREEADKWKRLSVIVTVIGGVGVIAALSLAVQIVWGVLWT